MKVTERWHSERMGRDIPLVRWGHYGVPVLLFPTAGGDAEEVERHQLIDALAPMVEAGRIKVYSCDSAAGQALQRNEGSPEHRMWLFNQYHQAVAEEVVPAIHADSSPQAVVLAGASIGVAATAPLGADVLERLADPPVPGLAPGARPICPMRRSPGTTGLWTW